MRSRRLPWPVDAFCFVQAAQTNAAMPSVPTLRPRRAAWTSLPVPFEHAGAPGHGATSRVPRLSAVREQCPAAPFPADGPDFRPYQGMWEEYGATCRSLFLSLA